MESQNIRTSYTAMSWSCLLAGYGFFPQHRNLEGSGQYSSRVDMTEIDEFIRRCALNFRPQNEVVQFK